MSNSKRGVREDRGGMGNSNWGMGKDRGVVGNGNRGSMGNSNGGMVGNSNRGGMDSMGNSDRGRSIGGCSRVGDILGDAVTIVSVGDSLDPAVREVDGVAARGDVAVPLLSLGEVGAAVVITHSIVVGIHWGLSQVFSHSSLHHHGGSVLGQGTGGGHQGGNVKDLEHVTF